VEKTIAIGAGYHRMDKPAMLDPGPRASNKMAARFSPPQRRALAALARHGRLDHVHAGWAIPGSFEIAATSGTAAALVAMGFCAVRNFTSLVAVKQRPPRRRAPC
jgi:hypothetical protein